MVSITTVMFLAVIQTSAQVIRMDAAHQGAILRFDQENPRIEESGSERILLGTWGFDNSLSSCMLRLGSLGWSICDRFACSESLFDGD